MTKLITRLGKRNDPKRAILVLEERAAGSFGGFILQDKHETSTYGNSLYDAMRMSFYWAGIHLVSIFDVVNQFAEVIEGGEEYGEGAATSTDAQEAARSEAESERSTEAGKD